MSAPGFSIAADHPALPGHFPGHPLVPGVVLLDAVIVAATERGLLPEAAPLQFHRVKFLHPVGPGEAVMLDFAPASRGSRLGFTGRSGDRVLFAGELAPLDAPA